VDEVERLLEQVISEVGVVRVWDELLRPVLDAVGERWARTGEGVEVEHLLSQASMDVFRRVADQAARRQPPPEASRPVLLASVDGDAHVLPLYLLAALLAEDGVRVRLLGASTPLPAMREAVRRLRPGAIFLWAQLTSPMNHEFASAVSEIRGCAQLVVGGPGWSETALPDGTRLALSVDEAVATLSPA
jgi:methanogenic corrinoid protein MtbC1